MLTGVHILLTYKCTSECDHCFLHCSPAREGTFTLAQLRQMLGQIRQLATVREVYFEGGEPFLFHPVLLEGVRLVRAAGLHAGIVTNAYWATSLEDALSWLRPLRELGIADLGVSDDDFHRTDEHPNRGELALRAAAQLGVPCARIRIERPRALAAEPQSARRGKPVVGGTVRFRGRAAERLTENLPLRPPGDLATCPHEELASPERVHIDAYGNVHLCQGVSLGNAWRTPLADLFARYDPAAHPIVGPLLRGGPARLAKEHALPLSGGYVDECHLCYAARKALLPAFPAYLCPKEVYGL